MDNTALIEAKVNELVDLLQKEQPGEEQLRHIKDRIDGTINPASLPKTIDAFRELDNPDLSRLEMMDDLELLLSQHQLDNTITKKFLLREKFNKMLVIIIGIIMITLGMGMIIMPAPPYFEMYTLFYFNPNDGVTIMDVLSLLIVFTGVYLFSSVLISKPKH